MTMVPLPFDLQKDRRGKLLTESEVDRWYAAGEDSFEIGLKALGEFRMGAESGSIIIRKNGSQDWINFGEYRFFLRSFHSHKPSETWDNPFVISSCGRWLALYWLYYHIHGTMDVIIIDIRDRRYRFCVSKENITPKSIRSHGDGCKMDVEYYYDNTDVTEKKEKQIEIKGGFLPIDMFYRFDPYTANTEVYEWVGGKKHSMPLQEYIRKYGIGLRPHKDEFSKSFEKWLDDWIEKTLYRVGRTVKFFLGKIQ